MLDKKFLLTYTEKGYDGLPHSFHAWFGTEADLKAFAEGEKAKDKEMETDLAIEILGYRPVNL